MLWKREMLSASYVPRWLELLDDHAVRFGCGLAFTIDPACENYVGSLEREQVVRRLATASGALGTSADYLFRTSAGLREHGIHDEDIERLRIEVAAAQAKWEV